MSDIIGNTKALWGMQTPLPFKFWPEGKIRRRMPKVRTFHRLGIKYFLSTAIEITPLP